MPDATDTSPESRREALVDRLLAGFAGCETLPIDDKFWRFYLLTP